MPNGSNFFELNLDQIFAAVGLCGDFDGNENNDFKNPQNIIEVNEISFVNTWKVS